MEFFTKFAIH